MIWNWLSVIVVMLIVEIKIFVFWNMGMNLYINLLSVYCVCNSLYKFIGWVKR